MSSRTCVNGVPAIIVLTTSAIARELNAQQPRLVLVDRDAHLRAGSIQS